MPFALFAGMVFAKCHSTEAEFMRIALRALIAAAEKGSGFGAGFGSFFRVSTFALTRLCCPAVISFRSSPYGLLMIAPLFSTLGKELFSPAPVGEVL